MQKQTRTKSRKNKKKLYLNYEDKETIKLLIKVILSKINIVANVKN
jgi:hypothetical protein